jgi:hypothetical protein
VPGLGHTSHSDAKQSPSRGTIVNYGQHRAARYGKVRGECKHPILPGHHRIHQFLSKFWLSDMDSNQLSGRSRHFPRLPLVEYSLPFNIHRQSMFASIICAFLGSGGKKNVCKSCARKAAVQTLCKLNSPRNLCKPCAKILACRGAWLACGASRSPPEGHGSIRGLKTTGSASGLFLSLCRFQLLQLFHRRLKILFHRRRFRIFQGAEF